MSFHSRYPFGGKPFLLGLTIPDHWSLQVRSGEPALALVQHALDRGFDFLLVPQSLASAFAPAEIAHCTMPESCARDGGDAGGRDLVWLRPPLLAAEGGTIVSTNVEGLDREHAPFLSEQLAAVRDAGEGEQERCVLLEIELSPAADLSDSEEDDTLEGFIASLGKSMPTNSLACAAANPMSDPAKLDRFLSFAQGAGYDGVSLVLSDPLNDLDSIKAPLQRAAYIC